MALNADLEKAVSSPNLTQLIGKEGARPLPFYVLRVRYLSRESCMTAYRSLASSEGTPIKVVRFEKRESLCNQPINESMRSVYRQHLIDHDIFHRSHSHQIT